jgi:hypothetical protein
MMKPESKRSISIEDLLRLKRAERPPAEFWTEFDRALRAKQLAALVEKRPWWQTMPRIFAFRRYHIPIGASAIVAITFLSLRDNQTTTAVPRHDTAARATNVAAVITPAAISASREMRRESAANAAERLEGPINGRVSVETGSAERIATTSLASEATSPGEISRMIPSIGTSAIEAAPEELSPSARAIAANLATVRGSEPVLARTLLSTPGTEPRTAFRAPIEPLHQITSPTERRRSNLLTAMVSMTSYEVPARTTERAASRLSQDELYDRFHRFDARGAGVMMKF